MSKDSPWSEENYQRAKQKVFGVDAQAKMLIQAFGKDFQSCKKETSPWEAPPKEKKSEIKKPTPPKKAGPSPWDPWA